MTDRSFKCTCCKRQILYEAKYQCCMCEGIRICKLCFKGGYHDHHSFVVRSAPDQDWKPSLREVDLPVSEGKEVEQLMNILQNDLSGLSSENFELLMGMINK
jgi:hypothetical protein